MFVLHIVILSAYYYNNITIIRKNQACFLLNSYKFFCGFSLAFFLKVCNNKCVCY